MVLSLLGVTLDASKPGPQRWERWRPTVDLARHEDLLVARLDLIHQPEHERLAKQVAADVRQVSPETEVVLHPLKIADPWAFEEVYGALHDFGARYPFAPEREEYLIHITTGTHVSQICLFLLAESRRWPARLLQTSPQQSRRGGPGSFAIIDLDLSKYDLLRQRFERERSEGLSYLKAGIPTKNRAFNELIERLEEVASASTAPILLLGPTGAGKTRLARRLYELKKARRQVEGAFVEVNCATMRGDHAMSTLFGHVKGSFTGALKDRAGLLQAADRGVLFLDEIGELGRDEQAMLLRGLEEGRFLPLGADAPVESDFQLIAGTNVDLGQAIHDGRFREDLLHRIDLWTFELPALRDRVEDIEPNVDYELDRLEESLGLRVRFTAEARAAFLSFAKSPEALWTGNFRELAAAIERLGTLAKRERIDLPLVEDEIAARRRAWARERRPGTSGPSVLDRALSKERQAELDPFDLLQLRQVAETVAGSRSLADAGRKLYSVSRTQKKSSNDTDRLKKYLAGFGLSFEDLQKS